MTTRTSSSSSSSSSAANEEISIPVPNVNRTAGSSTASQYSAVATGTPYDSVSIATTNTGFTNVTANTSVSQQQSIPGSIPIIRPPALHSEQQSNASAVNQPIRIDVASANRQYQQSGAQAEISPYSKWKIFKLFVFNIHEYFYLGGSSTSSSGGSLSSPGSTLQQPQQAQSGYQTSGQYQYQQAQ